MADLIIVPEGFHYNPFQKILVSILPPTREEILKSDKELQGKWGFWEDFPFCPHCNHQFTSHWNGGIKGFHWRAFRGTNLDRNEGDDGETETIKCPNCEKEYRATLHVERKVKITVAP